jgi:shikimate dehydrogenase
MITTALIGSPVEHSVSPILFKLYADEHELEYVHSKFDVKEKDLEMVIKSLGAFGFSGVNITLPYKSDVMRYMDAISPEATAIGAVNTIKVNNEKLEGYNTDAYGAIKAIEKAMHRKLNSNDSAIVFGTGGAARAIVWGLLENNINVLVVYRESESKRTQTMKRDFSNEIKFISYNELTSDNISKCSLLCNATSVGMYPNNDEMPIDINNFKDVDLSGVIMFDAIFNPVTTRLQKWSKERGATLAYGIDMMIYQGVIAFEYWTGKKVSEETIQKAVNILMKHN